MSILYVQKLFGIFTKNLVLFFLRKPQSVQKANFPAWSVPRHVRTEKESVGGMLFQNGFCHFAVSSDANLISRKRTVDYVTASESFSAAFFLIKSLKASKRNKFFCNRSHIRRIVSFIKRLAAGFP